MLLREALEYLNKPDIADILERSGKDTRGTRADLVARVRTWDELTRPYLRFIYERVTGSRAPGRSNAQLISELRAIDARRPDVDNARTRYLGMNAAGNGGMRFATLEDAWAAARAGGDAGGGAGAGAGAAAGGAAAVPAAHLADEFELTADERDFILDVDRGRMRDTAWDELPVPAVLLTELTLADLDGLLDTLNLRPTVPYEHMPDRAQLVRLAGVLERAMTMRQLPPVERQILSATFELGLAHPSSQDLLRAALGLLVVPREVLILMDDSALEVLYAEHRDAPPRDFPHPPPAGPAGGGASSSSSSASSGAGAGAGAGSGSVAAAAGGSAGGSAVPDFYTDDNGLVHIDTEPPAYAGKRARFGPGGGPGGPGRDAIIEALHRRLRYRDLSSTQKVILLRRVRELEGFFSVEEHLLAPLQPDEANFDAVVAALGIREPPAAAHAIAFRPSAEVRGAAGCMSTTDYRTALNGMGGHFAPLPGEHVLHLISAANGGANHVLNYVHLGNGRMNSRLGNRADALFAYWAGLERTLLAVDVSIQYGDLRRRLNGLTARQYAQRLYNQGEELFRTLSHVIRSNARAAEV